MCGHRKKINLTNHPIALEQVFTSYDIDIDGNKSSERVVNSFKNYFKRADIDLKEVAEIQDEFELEYAMSQIFSKKQKEIFLKKLTGDKLTKTEREYYSRSIKKKVAALANPDHHKLASKL